MAKKAKPKREVISAQAAADYLGVDKRTVLRMLQRGQLEGRKKSPLPNSAVEVYVDSLDKVDRERQIVPSE